MHALRLGLPCPFPCPCLSWTCLYLCLLLYQRLHVLPTAIVQHVQQTPRVPLFPHGSPKVYHFWSSRVLRSFHHRHRLDTYDNIDSWLWRAMAPGFCPVLKSSRASSPARGRTKSRSLSTNLRSPPLRELVNTDVTS